MMNVCLKTSVPLVASVTDATDSTISCPPSSTSEDSVPEGYLILTFDKKKKAVLKTAVFADVSDPRFTNDFDDENCGEEEYNDDWPQKITSEISNSDTDDSQATSNKTTEPNKSVIGSAYNSCYGEALWVGEGEISERDIVPNSGSKEPLNVTKDSWTPETRVSTNLLITTNQPCSQTSTSQTHSTSSSTSDDSWSSKIQHHTPRPISTLPYRRTSLPVRLAKRYDQGLHFMHSSWSRSVSSYRRQSLLDMDNKLGDHSRKMLRCDECGKYYRNEYSLHHHICLKRKDVWKKGDVPSEMVNGQIIYFCPTCHKPFKWLGNLTRHFYVHTGQRFFRCDICSKEFFSAYQVKRHMNSHTGMRFKCEVCDKPFTCKYACIWHTRQHYAYVE